MDNIITAKLALVYTIIIPIFVFGIAIFIGKLILNKAISTLKYKDIEIDFTDFKGIKENGEGESAEKLRLLLLKQLLFTQEFVNRFQPLISTFVEISKKWDEKTQFGDSEHKYPSLKYIDESLKRFRDLIRNSHFNYVINWECPIYDKVNSGYREYYIQNIGANSIKVGTPNLIEDCSKKSPSIDTRELPILDGYAETKSNIDQIIKHLKNLFIQINRDGDSVEFLETADQSDLDPTIFDRLSHNLEDLNKFITMQHDREDYLSRKYDYAMDIANTMYESLLYWNDRTPRIIQSETSSILYIIYQNLSMWLIRNDLPLSQVKLEQYLDTHVENLVAKINEEVVKQMPGFNQKMWEEALLKMKISDIDINNYFRSNIRNWLTGVQQVRFNTDIFLGMDDWK